MAEKPKHACRMTINIGSHTRQDIADVLLDFAVKVGNGEAGIEGCGGGPRGSYDYTLAISDTPSERDYFNQLRDYLAEQREQRNAGVPAAPAPDDDDNGTDEPTPAMREAHDRLREFIAARDRLNALPPHLRATLRSASGVTACSNCKGTGKCPRYAGATCPVCNGTGVNPDGVDSVDGGENG